MGARERMRTVRNLIIGGGAALVLAAALSCGGDDSGNSNAPSGSCTPSTNPATLVIQNNSICPQTITIARGGQLTIINQDSRSHDMTSDPHPSHTDCPELNQIGFLNTNQSRQSGNLNTVRSCGMHDHSDPDRASLRATITIQ
jgi:hypothetical protein